jgi:hypothetical protein
MGFNPTEQEVDEFNWNLFTEKEVVIDSLNNNMNVPSKSQQTEKQVGGSHYTKYSIQPWDIIDCYNLDFYEGNVLKYLLRVKGDRLEDLEKARHYLDKIIEGHT